MIPTELQASIPGASTNIITFFLAIDGHLAQTMSQTAESARGEDLAESIAQILGFADVTLGRAERGVTRALFAVAPRMNGMLLPHPAAMVSLGATASARDAQDPEPALVLLHVRAHA
jgi:hypothetical protein